MQNPLLVQQQPKFLQSTSLDSFSLETAQEIISIQRHLSYPYRLSLYLSPPPVEISIEEFETFALDRLQLLKCIESQVLRNVPDDQLKRTVGNVMKKYLPLSPTIAFKQKTNVDAERRKDCISHYILRLAFCKSEDLRQWFVRYEGLLFKLRWEMMSSVERQLFLESSSFNFEVISQSEKSALGPLLKQGTPIMNKPGVIFEREQFFKVPFEKAPDLVAKREILLKGGWAYVPQAALLSVVFADYKQNLISSLDSLAKALPTMDDDDRLKPLLSNLSRQYIGKDFNHDNSLLSGKISHEDIEKLSVHFPPCMRHLFEDLKRNSHLRHMGRMQFGLFLKGIGLSLEEALIFWRKTFSKMTDDQFQKGYAYNIRHNYGQEGKRVNYTPYSCVKIITTNAPSHGDNHGCPFKHFGRDNLHKMLIRHRLDDAGCQEVLQLAQAGHYQVACTKYFEITRGKYNPHQETIMESGNQHNSIDTIQHPNEFFELSLEYAGMKKTIEKEAADPGMPAVEISL